MKFTIDYNKWVAITPNKKIGKGLSALFNRYGYMCCLGQIAFQMCPALDVEKVRFLTTPNDLLRDELCSVEDIQILAKSSSGNTALSMEAMEINDSAVIPLEDKVRMLKALFNNHGIELEFINLPGIPA